MNRASDRAGWLGPALVAVGLVTALRLALLLFNRTDLFVDEAQYWLWGQRLDLGYYSKPPLIGWLIRAVGELAGSDGKFWIRMPGALLHGATALILAAAAARLHGGRAAFWVALSYVTLPFTTVGSLILSTDTVLAPAYAGALYFWVRLTEDGRARWALLAGLSIGIACLGKYAGVYFLLGLGLAALATREARVDWKAAGLLVLAFLLALSPNIVWNLTHQMTTVSHTMDNAGWVRSDNPLAGLNPAGLAAFFFSQFAVFGPVLFGGLLWGLSGAWREGGRARAFLLFALPPLLVVCAQAFLEKAYANWALTAYFPAILLVVPALLARAPRLLALSVLINGAVALALPVLTVVAPWPVMDEGPLLKRYLGRSEVTHQAMEIARTQGVTALYAAERDLLADFFYTGAGSEFRFYAPRPEGRPHNYYEQNFPLPQPHGPVLAILAAPPQCGGQEIAPVAEIYTDRGAYIGRRLAAYLVPGECAP